MVDVVRVWQLIHKLQVNSKLLSDFRKVVPPTNDNEKFYICVKPFFERANDYVQSLMELENKLLVTTPKTKK